jgi:hypothetical protein
LPTQKKATHLFFAAIMTIDTINKPTPLDHQQPTAASSAADTQPAGPPTPHEHGPWFWAHVSIILMLIWQCMPIIMNCIARKFPFIGLLWIAAVEHSRPFESKDSAAGIASVIISVGVFSRVRKLDGIGNSILTIYSSIPVVMITLLVLLGIALTMFVPKKEAEVGEKC